MLEVREICEAGWTSDLNCPCGHSAFSLSACKAAALWAQDAPEMRNGACNSCFPGKALQTLFHLFAFWIKLEYSCISFYFFKIVSCDEACAVN